MTAMQGTSPAMGQIAGPDRPAAASLRVTQRCSQTVCVLELLLKHLFSYQGRREKARS